MSSAEASSPRIAKIPLIIFIIMKIFRAIGLGIAIITLKFVVPDIWHAFESALVTFFNALQKTLAFTPGEILQGNVINFPQIPK